MTALMMFSTAVPGAYSWRVIVACGCTGRGRRQSLQLVTGRRTDPSQQESLVCFSSQSCDEFEFLHCSLWPVWLPRLSFSGL